MKNENLSDIRVILLSGEEFQRLERLSEILDITVDKATRDFNFDVFDSETFSQIKSEVSQTKSKVILETLSNIILTYPMMAERRVVVLRDFDSLHPETRKKVSAIVQKTPETTLVIIEDEKVTLTPKPPKKYLLVESFKPVYENRLPSWIQNRFMKRGKKATYGAMAHLINNVGGVLGELDNEIEKITIVAQDKTEVTEEDVTRVVGMFKRDTVWNFCNTVGLGDFDGAAQILTNLLESEKNRETFYISTLASHIMKIAAYNNLRKKGVTPGEAMKVVKDSSFLWKLNNMDTQARRFGQAEVRRALTALGHAESTLKKYGVDKRLVMELLIPSVLPGLEKITNN